MGTPNVQPDLRLVAIGHPAKLAVVQLLAALAAVPVARGQIPEDLLALVAAVELGPGFPDLADLAAQVGRQILEPLAAVRALLEVLEVDVVAAVHVALEVALVVRRVRAVGTLELGDGLAVVDDPAVRVDALIGRVDLVALGTVEAYAGLAL